MLKKEKEKKTTQFALFVKQAASPQKLDVQALLAWEQRNKDRRSRKQIKAAFPLRLKDVTFDMWMHMSTSRNNWQASEQRRSQELVSGGGQLHKKIF